MKSVLLSIQPKWCELIASGKKTVEIRKTRPKIEPPFKCYIYCTKPETKNPKEILEIHSEGKIRKANGKVIGEFVCDDIICAGLGNYCIFKPSETQIESLDLLDYADDKRVYGWHISDLVIYDKPKKLAEFKKPCEETNLCYPDNCNRCGWNILVTPPQSWCYVEEQEG